MSAHPSLAKAALWMAGWLTLMLLMSVAGRAATIEIDVFQIMELRALIGLVLLWPLVHAAGGLRAMRTSVIGQHVGRNVVHYFAQYAWLLALTMIPLAQLISIEFTMPVWTAIFAGLFLGERIGGLKIASIVLGILGVAIIVRPGLDHVAPGQLIALVMAVGFGISVTMVKGLTRHDSVVRIMFWMLVIQGLIGIVPALWVWRWPSAETWAWIAVIAACGTFSHYCMAKAMTYADATVVIPMDFLRVPLSAALGYLLYSEMLDAWTVAGAAMILFGNLLNLRGAAPPKAAATG
ncbi:DMT family transporter [Mesorhizobium australicum]|uniref:EamA-like transporter family protein n=1 Tax=Mesorhizobium australicum TaxID=536018 RepID=A0A1X7N606_9HYPH|nr:DMT family transporter [Mesorhizobium australicum]SMH32288.1 EamA-like transporter family protein [Mesorhizobium australicum]